MNNHDNINLSGNTSVPCNNCTTCSNIPVQGSEDNVGDLDTVKERRLYKLFCMYCDAVDEGLKDFFYDQWYYLCNDYYGKAA